MSTFGEELRRERELRKITLREISEATKINLRYLDALERNEFEHLPGGVFNKGFVRAFAQHIGVDPDALVNAYLLEEQAQNHRGGDSRTDVLRGRPGNSPARQGATAAPRGRLRPAARWLLIGAAVLAAVLAGLGWYWLGGGGRP